MNETERTMPLMHHDLEALRSQYHELEKALHTRNIECAGLQTRLTLEQAERVQMEGRLREAQSFESFAGMLSAVAIDFHNLLAVVKGYSELMQDQVGENPVVQAELREVIKAVDRAAALVKQILALQASAAAGR